MSTDIGVFVECCKFGYIYVEKDNRLASFFVYISNDKNESHTYLDEYRNKFIEKYGVDREVPLLEMLRFILSFHF